MFRFGKNNDDDGAGGDGLASEGRRMLLTGGPAAVMGGAVDGGVGEATAIGSDLGVIREIASKILLKRPEDLERLREVMAGKPRFKRRDVDPGLDNEWQRKSGTIDFQLEKDLLHIFGRFGSKQPLSNILSEQALERAFGDLEGLEDDSDVRAVRRVRGFLGPILSPATTRDDIHGGLRGFFDHLAQRAIAHPADFKIKRDGEAGAMPQEMHILSDIDHIEGILERENPDHPILAELKKANTAQQERDAQKFYELQQAKDKLEAEKQEKIQQEKQQAREEKARAQEDARARDIEDRKTNLKKRETYGVRVTYLGHDETRFRVEPLDEYIDKLPTRMDWVQFLQGYDGDNQRALRPEMGAQDVLYVDAIHGEVTFSDRAADFMLEQFGQRSYTYIDIPNRRMDADLHEFYYQPDDGEWQPDADPLFRKGHGISNPTQAQRKAALDEWRGGEANPQQELDL